MLILLIADVVVITNDSMSLFLLFKYFTIVGIFPYDSVFAAAVWYDITISACHARVVTFVPT